MKEEEDEKLLLVATCRIAQLQTQGSEQVATPLGKGSNKNKFEKSMTIERESKRRDI